MADIRRLLTLSKRIAHKARTLIPRSSNRVINGYESGNGEAWDSRWAQARPYAQLQLLAQRSRKSQNNFRRLVDEINFDLNIHGGHAEADIDRRVLGRIRDLGINENVIKAALESAKRSDKRLHKSGEAVFPMERHEANAKNAVRYRVGNCEENASLAFVMFAEYPGPNGDGELPDLEVPPPKVEAIAAVRPADHCFVVINRPPVNIQNVWGWINNGNVIICDPWWFHDGDALLANDWRGHNDSLLRYIIDNNRHLEVIGTVYLGEGHSPRYRASPSSSRRRP
jgi:hypothetical protein